MCCLNQLTLCFSTVMDSVQKQTEYSKLEYFQFTNWKRERSQTYWESTFLQNKPATWRVIILLTVRSEPEQIIRIHIDSVQWNPSQDNQQRGIAWFSFFHLNTLADMCVSPSVSHQVLYIYTIYIVDYQKHCKTATRRFAAGRCFLFCLSLRCRACNWCVG